MPEYCYPGSTSPWCSMDDAPGPWSMPPPSAGDLWHDVHQPRRWWLSFAYLSIWTSGSDVPALVTTSPVGTLQGDAGVLPDATVLFGNSEVDDDRRDGGEIRIGYWLVDGEFIGVEAHYWATASQETRFGVSSDFSGGAGGAILARPFINLNAAAQDAAIVAFPDFVRGGVTVDLSGSVNVDTTSILQSTGVTARHVLHADFERCCRVDLIGGYRFFQVDESLQVRDSVSDPGRRLIGPTTTASTDLFDTRNDFHSLEIGILAEIHRNRWTLELLGKCGLGNNHERVRIDGSTTTTSLGTTSTAPTGLLAQPTNIGEFSRDRFACVAGAQRAAPVSARRPVARLFRLPDDVLQRADSPRRPDRLIDQHDANRRPARGRTPASAQLPEHRHVAPRHRSRHRVATVAKQRRCAMPTSAWA